MKKVLFDTNVIIDILLARDEFAPQSLTVLKLAENKLIKGYVSASSIADIHYIVQRSTKDENLTMKGIGYILDILHLAKINRKVIRNAQKDNWNDFEDAIQYECAMVNHLNCIITRNEKDFSKSRISVCSPDKFLSEFHF